MTERRSHRMAERVRSELARLLLEEVADPRLQATVVTDVVVSNDLRHAKVFFTHSKFNTEEVLRGFGKASSFLRRRLGESLETRYTPELVFKNDTHNDEIRKIYEILS